MLANALDAVQEVSCGNESSRDGALSFLIHMHETSHHGAQSGNRSPARRSERPTRADEKCIVLVYSDLIDQHQLCVLDYRQGWMVNACA